MEWRREPIDKLRLIKVVLATKKGIFAIYLILLNFKIAPYLLSLTINKVFDILAQQKNVFLFNQFVLSVPKSAIFINII